MATLCASLRKILFNEHNFCGLCFEMIEQDFYNLQDEVILDSENSINMHEIICALLCYQTLDCIPTSFICQTCAQKVINSYKFIKMCKSNVKYFASTISCLHKFTKNLEDDKECDNSLFLIVDPHNNNVDSIYDEKQQYRDKVSLIDRLNLISCEKSICNLITIHLEPDKTQIYENNCVPINEEVQLSNIINPNEENNDNTYKCKNCTKVYSTALKLKQHYFRVHAPKNFNCSKCPRSFGSMLLLNRHCKDSHCTVVCSQCGKVYNNTHSLRHHERSHNIKLICQTCGKIYKGKQSFNNHIEQKLCQKMRKSNAESTFSCSYCGKKYSQKAGLSVHIRLEHENGKALICDWCGKKLSSSSRLKDHILKHTKQKNFSCSICGGKFVTKVSLLYHTRIHTGEKPYSCDYCEMRFLSASRRSEHVKQHHMGPDLECDICHGKFKGRTCLMRHRKRHFNTSSRLYKTFECSANQL